jgi:hypothetical protein
MVRAGLALAREVRALPKLRDQAYMLTNWVGAHLRRHNCFIIRTTGKRKPFAS